LNFTPRAAITLTFIAFGIVAGSQIGAIPVLRAQGGINSVTFGIVAGICTGAGILAMAIGGLASRRFDNRSAILFLLPVCFTALVANLLANSVFIFAITFIAFSLCFGALDIFMNAEASIVERDLKRPVFASFHGAVLYAIGSAGLASGYISFTYGAIWSALLALPWVALALVAVNQAIPHHAAHKEIQASRRPLPRKTLALIGIIIGLDTGAELACIQWSGQLLADMQPALAQYSGLGIAFYGLCNGTTRLMGDWLRARYSDMSLIAVSLAIGIAGFAILATGPGFAVSVLAFAITGAGLGMIFPCLFSVAANLAPDSRAAALSLASTVSGPPRILLPVLFGVLAQGYGLSAIYIAAGAACALALGFTFWTARDISHRVPA
jgi:hypothetical protein